VDRVKREISNEYESDKKISNKLGMEAKRDRQKSVFAACGVALF
jgi:hypothetical protein